jgi:IS1 family transposase
MLDAKHEVHIMRSMNKLPVAKRVQILAMLCEGSSMRSISRICDVSINTVTKLLETAGHHCAAFHDEMVRNVTVRRVQADEIWAFCYAKEKNTRRAKTPSEGAGDVWTWTALDADSKMMLSWSVGRRDVDSARVLMDDLSARVANRIQLTTDGLRVYLDAVGGAFGNDIDYGMLVKIYGASPESAIGRYSPAECIGAKKMRVAGHPERKHISTSYVERSNLSMRMGMRRFTRLTNAFSKKLENHFHALALYFTFYNFIRLHKTLGVTPAMAAGVTDVLWSWEDFITRMDASSEPKKRAPYKKPNAPALTRADSN